MNQELYHKFLVIVPEERHIIKDCPEITRYIHSFIVSKPCETLIEEIEEIISKKTIFGILTRGSLAQYLYRHDVKVPIFQLEYDLTNILDLLAACGKRGYKRIGMVEIGYNAGNESETAKLKSEMTLGDFYCVYYKLFSNKNLQDTILELKEKQVDCILGDVEPIDIAEEYGIPNMVFQIDNNCYRNTIVKALFATTSSIMEKSKNKFIEDITNLVTEAIIIVEEGGRIRDYNQNAGKMFFSEKSWGNLSTLFQMEMKEILLMPANSVVTIQEKKCIVNLIPVIIDEVQLYAAMINNVSYIEKMELSIRVQNKEKGLSAKKRFEDMIFQDEKMIRLVETAKKYARSSATIMICGATGTGKEVMASSIHNESLRSDGPFVAINCATFTESLIESELFGYEKGTFTGALASGKRGLFELAHRGTLFLDEVAELPFSMQAKLLRVLQEKEIRRIGGEKMIPVDVRVIVATNKTLCSMVEKGDFREDLYYRLSVLELVIPSLEERPKDIIPLFKEFVHDAAKKENKSIYWKDDSIFHDLLLYNWPGNVRELRNFAERIVLLAESYKLSRDFVHSMMQEKYKTGPKKEFSMPITNDFKTLEADYIRYLLNYFNKDKEKLCQYLGISRTTLWRKLGNG
ncbi:sigma 54-interacting transcriptional regulator [Emergencia sp.]|uniref:sigma 54-interacting transcriptional regulator n=1 Tax=Emergencia sp. TaxID=1926557 RepID=UPI003AF1B6FE